MISPFEVIKHITIKSNPYVLQKLLKENNFYTTFYLFSFECKIKVLNVDNTIILK